MKLRYIVEGKFSATFTATQNVSSVADANKKVISLKLINQMEGYMKHSGFTLYDNNNVVIKKY